MIGTNGLKTAALLAGLTALLVLIGDLLGGTTGMVMAFVLAVVLNFGTYWFSDSMALRMAGAREVSPAEAPELHALVDELCAYAGLPKPRVAIIDSPAPNAFATGRDPEHAVIAVTTGLLERLDREELQGVVGHEMAHVLNRDTRVTTLVVAVCGAIVVLCDLFWRFSLFGGSSRRRSNDRDGGGLGMVLLVVGIVALVLAPLGAALIQAAVSRRRESLADSSAVALTRNPAGLRSALEKLRDDSTVVRHTSRATAHLWIESPIDREGHRLNSMFDTHPPLSERIEALRRLEQSGPPVAGWR